MSAKKQEEKNEKNQVGHKPFTKHLPDGISAIIQASMELLFVDYDPPLICP